MSWSTLVKALAPVQSIEMMKNLQEGQTTLKQLGEENPTVYWYPGSGHDLTPLLFDVPEDPTGERMFPLKGPAQKSPLVLWMNDYWDHILLFPSNTDEKCWARPALLEQFRASVEFEKPSFLFCLPVTDVRQRSQATARAIPVSIFHVRMKNEAQGKHQRPENGDQYTVVFSFCESEFLLRNVFVKHKIRIRVVALLNQGGCSCQRGEAGQGNFEQYRDIPKLLEANKKTLGRVELYLVDRYAEARGFKAEPKILIEWEERGNKKKRPATSKQELSQEPFANAMMDMIKNNDPTVEFQMHLVGSDRPPFPSSCSAFLNVRQDEKHLIQQVVSGLQGPRVLDIGCCVGRHLRFIREIKPDAALSGVEIAEVLRYQCAKDFPGAKVFSRLEEISGDKVFDLVLLMGNGIGIFGTEEKTRQALRRIWRLLDDDGWLVLESGNLFNSTFYTAGHKIEYNGVVGPEFDWGYATPEWVRTEIVSAGFDKPSISPADVRGPFFLCCARKKAGVAERRQLTRR